MPGGRLDELVSHLRSASSAGPRLVSGPAGVSASIAKVPDKHALARLGRPCRARARAWLATRHPTLAGQAGGPSTASDRYTAWHR